MMLMCAEIVFLGFGADHEQRRCSGDKNMVSHKLYEMVTDESWSHSCLVQPPQPPLPGLHAQPTVVQQASPAVVAHATCARVVECRNVVQARAIEATPVGAALPKKKQLANLVVAKALPIGSVVPAVVLAGPVSVFKGRCCLEEYFALTVVAVKRTLIAESRV